MNTTEWLITATVAGPVIAAFLTAGFTGAIRGLAEARAQRIKHVPVSGADLYAHGVPLTEAQFREVFAAYQSELDELPPPADRTEWDLKRQYAAVQRLAVLTGTHPQTFPNVGDADQAWGWYAANNPYASAELPRVHGMPVSADWLADPARLLAAGAPRFPG
ncbi:MAG: hypothetical protein M3Z75_23075 [Actinomycetota bacterium]|nr:hypothetical protein [Actinomycetota bacterium]